MSSWSLISAAEKWSKTTTSTSDHHTNVASLLRRQRRLNHDDVLLLVRVSVADRWVELFYQCSRAITSCAAVSCEQLKKYCSSSFICSRFCSVLIKIKILKNKLLKKLNFHNFLTLFSIAVFWWKCTFFHSAISTKIYQYYLFRRRSQVYCGCCRCVARMAHCCLILRVRRRCGLLYRVRFRRRQCSVGRYKSRWTAIDRVLSKS